MRTSSTGLENRGDTPLITLSGGKKASVLMMNRVRIALSLFLLFPGLCLSSQVWAQVGPTLLVTTDMDCEWKLDGVAQGRLTAEDAKVVKLSIGQHLVQAKSRDGKDEWKTIITLDQDGQKILQITLKNTRQQRLDQNTTEVQQPPTSPAGTILNQNDLTANCPKETPIGDPNKMNALLAGRNATTGMLTIPVDMDSKADTPSVPSCIPIPINLTVPNKQKITVVVTHPQADSKCVAIETTQEVPPADILATIAGWLGKTPLLKQSTDLRATENNNPQNPKISYEIDPIKNTQATITVSCQIGANDKVAKPKRTIVVTYQDVPPVSVSAGAIVSMLGKKGYGVVTTPTSVSGNTVTSQFAVGVTSSSKVQFVPIGFLNIYGFGTRDRHLDFQAGIGINPNGSKTQVEYFLAPAFAWHNVYFAPGLHLAQAQYLTNGYTVGEIVTPQSFSVPTAYHSTLKFGIAISYSPKTSSSSGSSK
jgi:hypothetical protein